MRLENKVALISGGARGMGAAEAKLFAREGARVVIGDILEEDLYSLTYQTSNVDTADEQARGLLESLTHLFVKDCVPDSVTEQAGTLLYRFFV